MTEKVLQIKNINKSFFGVKVLDDISFDINSGEIHALLGENGAGKSTLIKIITGVYHRDNGTILLNGKKSSYQTPAQAYNNGIGVIFQETSLIEELSIIDNVFLGVEEKSKFGIFNNKKNRERYDILCEKMGFYFDPEIIVYNLTAAEKKLVEILKCISRNSNLIIMDEPTDALTDKETEYLFSIIAELRKKNVTIIYITHYLSEVFEIADRATVLKDGKFVGTVDIQDVTEQKIIKMMVGEDFQSSCVKKSNKSFDSEILRVENLSFFNKVKNVSFSVYKGEVLGITGVIGAGKTELAMVLFGGDRATSGNIYINNKKVIISSPKKGKKLGIGLLPEDRKKVGLIQEHSVVTNCTLASLEKHVTKGLISFESEKLSTKSIINKMNVKINSIYQDVKTLSGGNQQKVIIGKWLEAAPDIIIMDEPTRGVDVGAKDAIYKIVQDLSDKGKTIIFISTEVPEIVGISDRIMIMKKGHIHEICNRGVSEKEIYNKLLEGEIND
ncbi:MAG: sugar ABC transporter ATP-binding protein [Spirochaetaceae bacterium]